MRCSASVVVGGVVLGATLAVAVPPVGAQSQDLPPPVADVLACASVQRDDSLAPFQWPGSVTPMATGTANYD